MGDSASIGSALSIGPSVVDPSFSQEEQHWQVEGDRHVLQHDELKSFLAASWDLATDALMQGELGKSVFYLSKYMPSGWAQVAMGARLHPVEHTDQEALSHLTSAVSASVSYGLADAAGAPEKTKRSLARFSANLEGTAHNGLPAVAAIYLQRLKPPQIVSEPRPFLVGDSSVDPHVGMVSSKPPAQPQALSAKPAVPAANVPQVDLSKRLPSQRDDDYIPGVHAREPSQASPSRWLHAIDESQLGSHLNGALPITPKVAVPSAVQDKLERLTEVCQNFADYRTLSLPKAVAELRLEVESAPPSQRAALAPVWLAAQQQVQQAVSLKLAQSELMEARSTTTLLLRRAEHLAQKQGGDALKHFVRYANATAPQALPLEVEKLLDHLHEIGLHAQWRPQLEALRSSLAQTCGLLRQEADRIRALPALDPDDHSNTRAVNALEAHRELAFAAQALLDKGPPAISHRKVLQLWVDEGKGVMQSVFDLAGKSVDELAQKTLIARERLRAFDAGNRHALSEANQHELAYELGITFSEFQRYVNLMNRNGSPIRDRAAGQVLREAYYSFKLVDEAHAATSAAEQALRSNAPHSQELMAAAHAATAKAARLLDQVTQTPSKQRQSDAAFPVRDQEHAKEQLTQLHANTLRIETLQAHGDLMQKARALEAALAQPTHDSQAHSSIASAREFAAATKALKDLLDKSKVPVNELGIDPQALLDSLTAWRKQLPNTAGFDIVRVSLDMAHEALRSASMKAPPPAAPPLTVADVPGLAQAQELFDAVFGGKTLHGQLTAARLTFVNDLTACETKLQRVELDALRISRSTMGLAMNRLKATQSAVLDLPNHAPAKTRMLEAVNDALASVGNFLQGFDVVQAEARAHIANSRNGKALTAMAVSAPGTVAWLDGLAALEKSIPETLRLSQTVLSSLGKTGLTREFMGLKLRNLNETLTSNVGRLRAELRELDKANELGLARNELRQQLQAQCTALEAARKNVAIALGLSPSKHAGRATSMAAVEFLRQYMKLDPAQAAAGPAPLVPLETALKAVPPAQQIVEWHLAIHDAKQKIEFLEAKVLDIDQQRAVLSEKITGGHAKLVSEFTTPTRRAKLPGELDELDAQVSTLNAQAVPLRAELGLAYTSLRNLREKLSWNITSAFEKLAREVGEHSPEFRVWAHRFFKLEGDVIPANFEHGFAQHALTLNGQQAAIAELLNTADAPATQAQLIQAAEQLRTTLAQVIQLHWPQAPGP